MCHRIVPVAVIAVMLSASVALAQCGCNSSPAYAPVASSYVAGYAPEVAYAAPVTYTAGYAPAVEYAAPVTYTAGYAPAVAYAAPVTYAAYYAPAAAYAPTPYAAYYAPATAYSTYYTPYTAYSPVVATPYAAYYGRPGYSVYGTPQVYIPGEPVRNTFRALTP